MTTNFDTDPNTHTIVAAWASSPLGQPEREVRHGFAAAGSTESDEPTSGTKRAMLAAALACGISAGAALGVMLFDYTDTAQPTVVLPGSDAGLTSPGTPGVSPGSRLPGPPRALPGEPLPSPDNAPGPKPVVSAPAGGQQGPAEVTLPGDTTVVVDIPIPDYPPLPEKPGQQEPEPPKPEPPVLDDPNFKLPEPPKPDPQPDPPEFVPDLPLAPLPNPDPTIKLPLAPVPKADPAIKLPLIPSPKLNPQPEPPSVGLNPQPEPPKPPPFVIDPVLPKW